MAKKQLYLNHWKIDYEGQKLDAVVPGDIVNDLFVNGVILDPLFGDNYKTFSWIHDRDWKYSCNFELDKEALRQSNLKIILESVDTFADVYINGQHVGVTDNMFLKYEFDFKSAAVEGKNNVCIIIHSIREVLATKSNPDYSACFNDDRIFARKPQCHFGWDWAPDFPGTGLVGNVIIESSDIYNIQDVKIETEITGAVSFNVSLKYNNRLPNFEGKGDETLELKVAREPFGNADEGYSITRKVFGEKNMLNLSIANPKLWYPNGYGEQPLYPYIIRLHKDGKVSDTLEGLMGIREVVIKEQIKEQTGKYFNIYINGDRFRAVGSNWVPAKAMTGNIEEERYEKLIRAAKEGGLNMLRVWGGGLYEKDCFYELCDRYGIMVWQDFMFACSDIQDDINEFRNVIQQEATYQIKRLRNHPSIALWCGGNEMTDGFRVATNERGRYTLRVLLAGLCHEYDGTRRYVWDSPFAHSDVGNDVDSGDCHLNALAVATAHKDILNYRKYQWANDNAFDSECAVLGMCRRRSFDKFMPEDKRWPQNPLWYDRLSRNPYDDSVVEFTERINMNVEAMFGGWSDLNDYIKKSMVVHAEVLKSEIDYFRAIPYNSGVLNWMYNDIWGNGTWSIIDYYYEKKPAFYAMKRAGKRQNVSIVLKRDGYYCNVINDTKEPLQGALTIKHRTIEGKLLQSEVIQLSLTPFSQAAYKISYDDKVKNAYFAAEINGIKTIYFYDLWKDKTFKTDIKVSKVMLSDKKAEITISAVEFARFVSVELPDGHYTDMSDNYFDIEKGDSAKIIVTSDKEFELGDIKVLTFADEWTE